VRKRERSGGLKTYIDPVNLDGEVKIRDSTHRTIRVLKWFFKRLCGFSKNHLLLKNHLGNGATKNYF